MTPHRHASLFTINDFLRITGWALAHVVPNEVNASPCTTVIATAVINVATNLLTIDFVLLIAILTVAHVVIDFVYTGAMSATVVTKTIVDVDTCQVW
jgi:hypothetical protein